MDAISPISRSKKLSDLAQQLRHQKPCHSSSNEINSSGDNSTSSSNSITADRRRAAVLICLFEGDHAGDLRVFLTQRSSSLSSHSGEVSLPGGKMEDGDSDEIATALREAKEEIGLDPSLVHVVSVLDPFTMMNGMVVVPVVGLLFDKSAFCPTPNAAEVEAIFDAPLEMFLKDENRREVEREWMGEKYMLHYFDYEDKGRKYTIFALTAGILIETASLVYQQLPAFEVRKPNFWHKVSTSSL